MRLFHILPPSLLSILSFAHTNSPLHILSGRWFKTYIAAF